MLMLGRKGVTGPYHFESVGRKKQVREVCGILATRGSRKCSDCHVKRIATSILRKLLRAGFMVHVLGSKPSDILPELRFM